MDPLDTGAGRDAQPLILIIDDDPEVLGPIRAMLHAERYRTMCIEDAVTGLNLAEKYRPSAILLDVHLPGLDGFDLCRELKNRLSTADTPILLMSDAPREESLLARCFDAGAHDLLPKPLPRVETLGRLRVVLREAQIRDAYKRIAVQDPATGLFNRRHFVLHASEAILRTRQGGGRAALLLADVDHLAGINDRYGHDLGDEVLLTLSRLIRRLTSTNAKAGRIGGDEFALVLSETTPERALAMALRLRNTFSAIAFDAATEPKHFHVTIGVACFDGHDDEFHVDPFLRLADEALFAAKAIGPGQVAAHWKLDPAAIVSVPPEKRHARSHTRVPSQRSFVAPPTSEPPCAGSQPTPPQSEPRP